MGVPRPNWRSTPSSVAAPNTSSATVVSDAEMKQRDRENILAALAESNWRIHGPGGAAELLEMRPTTLASRVKRMGLKKPDR